MSLLSFFLASLFHHSSSSCGRPTQQMTARSTAHSKHNCSSPSVCDGLADTVSGQLLIQRARPYTARLCTARPYTSRSNAVRPHSSPWPDHQKLSERPPGGALILTAVFGRARADWTSRSLRGPAKRKKIPNVVVCVHFLGLNCKLANEGYFVGTKLIVKSKCMNVTNNFS
jgi:hypothetical protein